MITLNNFSRGSSYRNQERETGSNVQVNRAGLDSHEGKGGNGHSNGGPRQKRNHESPEKNLPPNMNEYGDELYHPDGSPYLKGPPMKKRNQQESRDNFGTPHARSNATNIGGSGPRDGARNNYTQKERGPGRGTGRFTPKERNTPGERKFLPCRVCKEATHSGLFGCADFKKYIPGGPNGASSLSKDICKFCLGTVFNECKHNGLKHYQKY